MPVYEVFYFDLGFDVPAHIAADHAVSDVRHTSTDIYAMCIHNKLRKGEEVDTTIC